MYNANALELLSITYDWIKPTRNENVFAFKTDLSNSDIGLVDCFGTIIVTQVVGNQPMAISSTTPIKIGILNSITNQNEVYISNENKKTKTLDWKMINSSIDKTIRFTQYCTIKDIYTEGYALFNSKFERTSEDYYLNLIEDRYNKVIYGVHFLETGKDGYIRQKVDIFNPRGKLITKSIDDEDYLKDTYKIGISSLYSRNVTHVELNYSGEYRTK